MRRRHSLAVSGPLVITWVCFGLCLLPTAFGQLLKSFLNTNCDLSETAMTEKVASGNIEIPMTCIPFNRRKRCFYTYIPDCAATQEEPIPLVYDIHPLAICPSTLMEYSGWFELATKECFAVVWPVGISDPFEVNDICWAVPAGMSGLNALSPETETTSCCCINLAMDEPLSPVDPDEVGDVDFLREIGSLVYDQVAASSSAGVTIDPQRIYMSGHSNGCYLSHAMAMKHSDFVAGVGCMAGLWVTPPAANYSPTPIWSIIGARDIVAPMNGFNTEDAYIPPYSVAFQKLSELNGCQNVTQTKQEIPSMDNFFGKGGLTTQTASGCTNGATVEFLTLATGGHTPYLNAPEKLPPLPLASSTTIDTTALAWEFLSSRRLAEIPPEFVPEVPLDPSPRPTAAPTLSLFKEISNEQTMLDIAHGPTTGPTSIPTASPSTKPTAESTIGPTHEPTRGPTKGPSVEPTSRPTAQPTSGPSMLPTVGPPNIPTTVGPTLGPTLGPTMEPSLRPTFLPTSTPTAEPTKIPTKGPTFDPTILPTLRPTTAPTMSPSHNPSYQPSSTPSNLPSTVPTKSPTREPTSQPSQIPTASPSGEPTESPTASPTREPTTLPTGGPTKEPTAPPSADPTERPTASPTKEPTTSPTKEPTKEPTASPTEEKQTCLDPQQKCGADADCCSNRCILQTCQAPVSNAARTRLNGGRGGVAAEQGRNGGNRRGLRRN